MIPQIRKLEEQKLVRKEGKTYALTDIGKVIADVFSSFIRTIEIIEKHGEFLESHDISAIPQPLLNRIYELGDCRLIEHRLEEIFEPHEEFFENLSKSKSVMGVAPIFNPAYPSFFLNLAQQNVRVVLVLTRNVFEKVKKEYRENIQRFLDCTNTKVYVLNNEPRIAFVVSDTFFSFSLFFKSGTFDSQKDLVSFDRSALKWGEELFNYYKERSELIRSL